MGQLLFELFHGNFLTDCRRFFCFRCRGGALPRLGTLPVVAQQLVHTHLAVDQRLALGGLHLLVVSVGIHDPGVDVIPQLQLKDIRELLHQNGGICAGDVWYYTVHLGWWKDEAEPFAPQWEKLSQAAGAKKTAFLLGDFNSEADVRGEGYDLVLRSGWQDTYRLAQQRDAGYTVVEAIDGWRDAPDAAEKKRIDQIWCSKAVAVKSSRVVFNGLQEPQVSDHAGVMIEL